MASHDEPPVAPAAASGEEPDMKKPSVREVENLLRDILDKDNGWTPQQCVAAAILTIVVGLIVLPLAVLATLPRSGRESDESTKEGEAPQ